MLDIAILDTTDTFMEEFCLSKLENQHNSNYLFELQVILSEILTERREMVSS